MASVNHENTNIIQQHYICSALAQFKKVVFDKQKFFLVSNFDFSGMFGFKLGMKPKFKYHFMSQCNLGFKPVLRFKL